MVRIIKTEFYKLKRYHILWAGVALMLLSVLLTLFTSMANDGSVWDFAYLTEQVIKNNMSMIFPMCISLIAGYMISREQTDDTLKNILTVPVSFKRLLTGKLIVCGVLSIVFGLICSLFNCRADCRVPRISFFIDITGCSTNYCGKFLFISCSFTDYYYHIPKVRQFFNRCYCGICVWIRRNVCSRKYDISKYLSDYSKPWNDPLSQLRCSG